MIRVNISEIVFNDDYSYTYKGEAFTGIAIEHGPAGELISEISFIDGVQEGPMREWYQSGAKQSEKNLRHGALHGVSMEWFETGKPKKREVAEFGILLESDEWDEDGALVATYRLSESDANFKILQQLRSAKWQK